MEEEGHDPATFKFDSATVEAKTPAKRTRRSESTSFAEQDSEETPTMENMIVQDDAGEEEETEQTDKQNKASPSKPEANMEVEETEKLNRKRELKEEPEASEPKKLCLDKDAKSEDDHKIENNTDAEDSINLDLGDDELLNEEVRFYFFSVTVKLPPVASKMSNGVSNGFMMEID